jgi:RNA polymerase sigma-70 factor, ECF subfamily
VRTPAAGASRLAETRAPVLPPFSSRDFPHCLPDDPAVLRTQTRMPTALFLSMGPMSTNSAQELQELLDAAAAGDRERWGALLSRHRERLRRMVALRLDRRLQGRVDASDVIQETHIEAMARLPEYVKEAAMPFFLWLRFLTAQKMLELHRRHLGAQMRDAGREISLYRQALPETSSVAIAAQLLGHGTGPSEAAMRAERAVRLQEALNGMDALDREVLALRHFEQLDNAETAQSLGIKESAASKRYVRALRKLKEILTQLSRSGKGI